jgi:predicted transcriptional regulator of viral defense system
MLKIFKLLETNKRYFSGREISLLLDIKEKNRRVTLSRLVKRKILRRLRRNLYEVIVKPTDVLETASTLYQPSYLSFSYCLGELGISNQIAYEIEFATPKKTKRLILRDRSIIFRKINKKLFFGYTLKDKIFIAEPEKALLDTLYLKSKGLASLPEEELNLKGLSRQKFLKMSRQFPAKVQEEAKRLAKGIHA